MNKWHAANLTPSSAQFVILTSLLITGVFNYPFLAAVFSSIAPSSVWEWLFFASVPTLLTCINIVFLSLFGALFVPRFTAAITFILCAVLLYATAIYGVIFDSNMIQNIVETNAGEAFSYLNISFVGFFLLLGLVPVFVIFGVDIRGSFTTRFKKVLAINVLAIAVMGIVGTFLYKDYAAVGRNNSGLVKLIIPYAFYDSGYKYLRDTYFYPPLPYRILDKHPTISMGQHSPPGTVVVVVGETARADKFGSNGYDRDTTPNLQSLGAVSFGHVSSCGTATAVSVPCMFSRLDRQQYESRIASSEDNVLDIIHRAGAAVTWIDNNSSCKGVCKRIESVAFDPARDPDLCDGDYCFDEVLVKLLAAEIQNPSSSQRVIVLHMIGSHGPTYYRRYPDEFAKFLPDCPRSDIQNCGQQQLVNTYDNTIVYTDYVLGQIIQLLAEVPNSAMLYLSDHGESLGEKGLYLHGFPYKLAPDEQTHIPMLYWDSALTNAEHKVCIQQQATSPISQDNLYDTLLGLTHVASTTYQSEKDIFKPCQV